jgi:hypothetical protein
MTTHGRAATQLHTIGWLQTLFAAQGIDYWLFGGWAVDFHVGRVTRDHADVDFAVWQADLDRIRVLLEAQGWEHAPEPERMATPVTNGGTGQPARRATASGTGPT